MLGCLCLSDALVDGPHYNVTNVNRKKVCFFDFLSSNITLNRSRKLAKRRLILKLSLFVKDSVLASLTRARVFYRFICAGCNVGEIPYQL